MTVETEIAGFLAEYTADLRQQFKDARMRMRKLVPHGYELVYDNYNALVFGYAPNDRGGQALISIAGYPQWVTLFFLRGVALPDPTKRLQGEGSTVRGIRLDGPETLDEPDVRALLERAMRPNAAAFAAAPRLTTIVKSVSAKRRSRKPTTPVAAAPSKGPKSAKVLGKPPAGRKKPQGGAGKGAGHAAGRPSGNRTGHNAGRGAKGRG